AEPALPEPAGTGGRRARSDRGGTRSGCARAAADSTIRCRRERRDDAGTGRAGAPARDPRRRGAARSAGDPLHVDDPARFRCGRGAAEASRAGRARRGGRGCAEGEGVNRLQTGIDELDLILGGGIPTGSLLVIGGPPGTGKTILANQICFANASQERQALYYTTLSEPHAKLIRFLDSFSFYDENALGRSLEIIHLPIPEQSDGLASLADEIARKSFEARPALVVIDSSKTLHDFAGSEQVRQIVYDLASKVGHTDAVLLLVGEYTPEDAERLPEFAVADGIVYLGNELRDAFDRRTLRVRKMRGSAYLGGQHSIRIGADGVEVFARLEALAPQEKVAPRGRVSSGVPALDKMLGGGLPGRSATLIAGPSGSGKTLLSLHFINEGIRKGERCHYVSFREDPEQLLRKAG